MKSLEFNTIIMKIIKNNGIPCDNNENHENHIILNDMKILKFHARIMKIMQIIDFHTRIIRIMKIKEFHMRITKILEIIEFQ